MSFGKRKKQTNILEELSENTINEAAEKTKDALEGLKTVEQSSNIVNLSYNSKDEDIQAESIENARLQAEKNEELLRIQKESQKIKLEKETENVREEAEYLHQKQINEEQDKLTSEQEKKLSKYLQELQKQQGEIAKSVGLFELVPALKEASEVSISNFEENEITRLASELEGMDQRSEKKAKAKDTSRARRLAEENRLDTLYNEQEAQRVAEVRRDIKEQRDNEKKNVRVTESNLLNRELYDIEESEKEKLTTYSNVQTNRIRQEKSKYIKMCEESLNSILGR
jgi:hypothetical protein